MENYYVSPTLVKKKDLGKTKRNHKIKINNPSYDRPVNVFLGITIIISIFSVLTLKIEWLKLFSRLPDLINVFRELSKFNFTNFDFMALAFLESVTVTILATIYSVMTGLFMGALMAKNIAPSRILGELLSSFNTLIRAVPTIVWVLLMIASLGFGPAPGIIGLSFHASAFFAKAFSQAFEEVEKPVIEALQATGANRIQIFFGAIMPASLTAVIAWVALRFEINFSESAILGMAGAGGIGYSIASSMTGYNYGRAGISILMVFVFAYALELGFSTLKRSIKVGVK